jgi:hypothetical protein
VVGSVFIGRGQSRGIEDDDISKSASPTKFTATGTDLLKFQEDQSGEQDGAVVR